LKGNKEMGTRSLTYVYDDDGETLVCMYRQFDGYPRVHGFELSEFLMDAALNNNGMDCLAAQMIARFKTAKVGGIYLHPTTQNQDCWQEFEYHVFPEKVRVMNPENCIFEGPYQEFCLFCSDGEIE
jgi:hypothetical protein